MNTEWNLAAVQQYIDNGVIYVVEIPQSPTAHQVTASKDYRYYRRYNFEAVPMEDYEVRLVMNRAVTPDASVEFSYKVLARKPDRHNYVLGILIKNLGPLVISHFKLEFTFPKILLPDAPTGHYGEHITHTKNEQGNHMIAYRSKGVLFPRDKADIGKEISWRYYVDKTVYQTMRNAERQGHNLSLRWTLFADNMTPKSGEIPFSKLQQF
jgi:hypothetical protein